MRLSEIPNVTTLKGISELALHLRTMFGLEKADVLGMTLPEFGQSVSRNAPHLFFSISDREMRERTQELLGYYSTLAWCQSGFPAFDLTHSLASSLLLTDPSDVRSSDLEMPYQAFAIRVPPGFLHLQDERGLVDASVALVHMGRFHRDPDEEPARRIVIHLIAQSSLAELQENDAKRTTAWELLLPPGDHEFMGDWLQMEIKSTDGETSLYDKSSMHALRRLFINVCLYVAANGKGQRQEQRGKKKKKGKKKKTVAYQGPEVWVLGKEVKPDSNLIDAAKQWSRSQSLNANTPEWSVQSKYTVRGHWRNQAHGPNHSLRRRQWIQPYWKGEGTLKIGHLYTTKDS